MYSPPFGDTPKPRHPGHCCLECLTRADYHALWHEGTGCCCKAPVYNPETWMERTALCLEHDAAHPSTDPALRRLFLEQAAEIRAELAKVRS